MIARYDQIGGGYALTRREDPHISRAIRSALGDARSVVNVGAGTGGMSTSGSSTLSMPGFALS
jgi:hypothetical protein